MADWIAHVTVRCMGQRLGQHFLNAQWVARDLIASLSLHADETILEIGPGKGALTKELLKTRRRVVAIEKDPLLVAELRTTFISDIEAGHLTIIERDIRDVSLIDIGLKDQSYVLAANIPYYITGEIIRKFLETDIQPRAIALLIQKEVAERIVARNGKESILSLSVKVYGKPRMVAKVPASCFNPPPSVDSAILLISEISRASFREMSEQSFFSVIKAGFAAKRKQLGGNLRKVFGEKAVETLEGARLKKTVRAEDLTLEEWRRVVQGLQH